MDQRRTNEAFRLHLTDGIWIYGGVRKIGGTPIAGWFIMGTLLKWMMTGGTPILGKPPYDDICMRIIHIAP